MNFNTIIILFEGNLAGICFLRKQKFLSVSPSCCFTHFLQELHWFCYNVVVLVLLFVTWVWGVRMLRTKLWMRVAKLWVNHKTSWVCCTNGLWYGRQRELWTTAVSLPDIASCFHLADDFVYQRSKTILDKALWQDSRTRLEQTDITLTVFKYNHK